MSNESHRKRLAQFVWRLGFAHRGIHCEERAKKQSGHGIRPFRQS
jgi:hypothetical protein